MRNVIQSRGRVRWIQDRRIACLPGWSGSRVSTAAITAPPQFLPFLHPEPPPPAWFPYLLPATTSTAYHGFALVCAKSNPCRSKIKEYWCNITLTNRENESAIGRSCRASKARREATLSLLLNSLWITYRLQNRQADRAVNTRSVPLTFLLDTTDRIVK